MRAPVSPVELLRKYRRKGVLIDTNLLIGYIIGNLNPQHLQHCRATKGHFSPDDFLLLRRFVSQFSSVVTTPHILTEVSNLATRLPDELHADFRMAFRLIIDRLSEEFEPSKRISAKEEFLRFGLTDTAISSVAPGRYLVLTDDLTLAGYLNKKGVAVINFNNVRFDV